MTITQAANIVRVTWVYDLIETDIGVETSQHSVTFLAGSVPGDEATLLAVLNDMANAALASQAANVTANHWSPNVKANHCRVALEATNGHTIQEAIVAATGALAWQGSAGGKCLPWQDAVCISLYSYPPGSFVPAGKTRRGRFYLPPPSVDVLSSDNTTLVDSTAMTDIAHDWAQVLKELQQHFYSGFPDFAPTLVVNSRSTATAHAVTYVRWDNKLDTQRRRAKKLTAVVSQAVFPAP